MGIHGNLSMKKWGRGLSNQNWGCSTHWGFELERSYWGLSRRPHDHFKEPPEQARYI